MTKWANPFHIFTHQQNLATNRNIENESLRTYEKHLQASVEIPRYPTGCCQSALNWLTIIRYSLQFILYNFSLWAFSAILSQSFVLVLSFLSSLAPPSLLSSHPHHHHLTISSYSLLPLFIWCSFLLFLHLFVCSKLSSSKE